MSIKAQISTLIQLANADGEFSGEEKQLIYMIGKANRMKEEEIDDLVANPVEMPPVSTMSDDDKFEYLFQVVQLMKIDSQVYLSEIKYCEEVAERLGFKKKVIGALSKQIYSDPTITTNVDALRIAVKKYEI
ncbi:MAG: TerB family tellurite resistance protein [Cytophagales bacterium]|nr:TerB family tellurite resistance protein [Cytophagales bacterium]